MMFRGRQEGRVEDGGGKSPEVEPKFSIHPSVH